MIKEATYCLCIPKKLTEIGKITFLNYILQVTDISFIFMAHAHSDSHTCYKLLRLGSNNKRLTAVTLDIFNCFSL